MDSKRRANCCSRLTFWYANPLIDSVSANNGQMHKKMIEDMNTDPERSERLLKHFQDKLRANAKQWQLKNNNKVPSAEYEQFTRNAIFSTFGCHFCTVSFIALCAELLTLVSTFMIRNIANYLESEESDS